MSNDQADSMAYTLAQYQALCEAIATGAEFVRYSDKEVRYMPVAEMKRLKAEMEAELGIAKPRRRRTIGVYDKGLAGNRVKGCGHNLPIASPPSQTKGLTFTVYIKTTPGTDTIELRNGIVINKEYVAGNELNIPYLKSGGIYVLLPFYVNNEVRQDIPYTQGSGKIVKPSGNWEDGDYITIQLEYNG